MNGASRVDLDYSSRIVKLLSSFFRFALSSVGWFKNLEELAQPKLTIYR